ncbi:type IV pili twitching motility protein PilT [bacterium Unc6]|nr:type IV pili twitching motility protein PilT [bacterium Unc6]
MGEKIEIRTLLKAAVQMGASDLHLTVQRPPQARVAGELVSIPELELLTPDDCQRLAYELLNDTERKTFEQEKEIDLSYGVSGLGRFRINLYFQRGSVGASIRALPYSIPSFKELGLPEKTMAHLAVLPYGLILVSGPTGSGKTTTMASIIEYINQERSVHIISIEDPIEYLYHHKKSTVAQREIGSDTTSFARALRHVLRQDPNVILIGEIRDPETARAALRIAETGHLVISTVHSGEVVQVMSRIVDMFPASEQNEIRVSLSLTLRAIIVQQLIPRKGKAGRVLATEMMLSTPGIQNLIREGKYNQIYTQIQLGGGESMHTMNSSLHRLYLEGQIEEEIMFKHSSTPKELKALLKEGRA